MEWLITIWVFITSIFSPTAVTPTPPPPEVRVEIRATAQKATTTTAKPPVVKKTSTATSSQTQVEIETTVPITEPSVGTTDEPITPPQIIVPVTVTQPPPPEPVIVAAKVPTCTLTAETLTPKNDTLVRLTWTSTDATVVNIKSIRSSSQSTAGIRRTRDVSGSEMFPVEGTVTYQASATGEGGTGVCELTLVGQ
jgi:hypothetical protein